MRVNANRVWLTWPVGILALALAIGLGLATNRALAEVVAGGQAKVTYIDEEEEKAYNAAKDEPDPAKRAAKLMEFFQKYPNTKLMDGSDFEAIKTLEAESTAFYSARQEPDFEKRSALLLEVLKNNPESKYVPQIEYEYKKMLKELSQNKQYEKLESLGEKWLKTHPNDKDAYGFVAEAADHLRKYDRYAQCLEALYKMDPSADLAREIYAGYSKAHNSAKQTEWADKLFKMPEFKDDYMLRYGYVMEYSKENNLPKAAEYAQLTLQSASLAKQQDGKSVEQLRKVRQACYHVIASDLMERGKYPEAIAAFKEAIKAEKYGQGYYKIGACLENQKDVEQANLYYAIAELMGEEDAQRAKARLEVLYKALHNDTLIGINKVYEKARKMMEEPGT
jgi:tetratricopeptide (TPR) repeat protein